MERVLQIALLRRSEFGIEQDHVGRVAFHQAPQFVELARADKRGGIRRRPGLHDGFLDTYAGSIGQGFQLFERLLGAVRDIIRRAARA